MNRKTAAVFLFAAAFALAAIAGSKEDEWLINRWRAKTAESAEALNKGDYKQSLRIADGLIKEMMEGLGPGNASTDFFGAIIVHKALANAGLGKQDDAWWYWQTALALAPKAAETTLAMFAEPAKLLHEPPAANAPPAGMIGGDVVAPRLLRKVEPAYPRGAHAFAVDGKLVVEVTINRAGVVTAPHIVKSLPAPTLSYAALEAVKQWRFRPGYLAGEPVEVLFNVTINYRK